MQLSPTMNPADTDYYPISDFENSCTIESIGASCVSDLHAQKLSLAQTASSNSTKSLLILKTSKLILIAA